MRSKRRGANLVAMTVAGVVAASLLVLPGMQRQADAAAPPVTIPETPGIALIKVGALDMTVVAPSTRADPGDKITYSFTVTNIGTVTLTEVRVTDPKVTVTGGMLASLPPGASDGSTFRASYTLTAADIAAGKVENTATASGLPPGAAPVSDTASETVIIPRVTTSTTQTPTTTTTRPPTSTTTSPTTTTSAPPPSTTAGLTTSSATETSTTAAGGSPTSSPPTVGPSTSGPPTPGTPQPGLSTTLIVAIVVISVVVVAAGGALWWLLVGRRGKKYRRVLLQQGRIGYCEICGKPAPGGVCSGCDRPSAECTCPRSKVLKEGERLCTTCGMFKIVGQNCAGCGKAEGECDCLEPAGRFAGPDPLKGLNISKGCRPDRSSA